MGPHAAFVSTYPPRHCGIATFTRDLSAAIGNREIVALHRRGDPILYPMEVTSLIRADARADYSRAVDRMARAGVEVVSIQHEYGIFGGRDGAYILELIDGLERARVPMVATLHTVLRNPSRSQRAVMDRILGSAAAAVVMSHAAAGILVDSYGAEPSRVRMVPHGVPDLPLVDPALHKKEFGLEDREVVLSFGLLGPGKGYEHAIEAMARVRKARSRALFVVLGSTHPNLVLAQGEAYRDRLRGMVDHLGLADHVRFVDRFVAQDELGRWLLAADALVMPYPNLDQVVSGTLSYALAAGRPVVSTPFAYASEVLAGGRGILVAPGSTAALADALEGLLADAPRRRAMGGQAYLFSRRMLWREVAAEYRSVFEEVADGGVAFAQGRVAADA